MADYSTTMGILQPPSGEKWGYFAMLFIAAYDGRKSTNSKAIQSVFYLFYPVHLLVLYVLGVLPGVCQIGISLVP